ncbi:MAG: hypothetical protein NTW69_06450 [Chloroflexi bacterium]|nr:hypothetical protein [Chloroflexota bacterium]
MAQTENKVKAGFFIRASTLSKIKRLAEKTQIRQSVLIDLIFADEAGVNDVLNRHVSNIQTVLSQKSGKK